MKTTPEQNERRERLRQDLEYFGVPIRESRLDSSALFSAADNMNMAIMEMLNDWQKGDFELPKLAEHDLCSAHEYAVKYAKIRAENDHE